MSLYTPPQRGHRLPQRPQSAKPTSSTMYTASRLQTPAPQLSSPRNEPSTPTVLGRTTESRFGHSGGGGSAVGLQRALDGNAHEQQQVQPRHRLQLLSETIRVAGSPPAAHRGRLQQMDTKHLPAELRDAIGYNLRVKRKSVVFAAAGVSDQRSPSAVLSDAFLSQQGADHNGDGDSTSEQLRLAESGQGPAFRVTSPLSDDRTVPERIVVTTAEAADSLQLLRAAGAVARLPSRPQSALQLAPRAPPPAAAAAVTPMQRRTTRWCPAVRWSLASRRERFR